LYNAAEAGKAVNTTKRTTMIGIQVLNLSMICTIPGKTDNQPSAALSALYYILIPDKRFVNNR